MHACTTQASDMHASTLCTIIPPHARVAEKKKENSSVHAAMDDVLFFFCIHAAAGAL
jgi:hypothetical protein